MRISDKPEEKAGAKVIDVALKALLICFVLFLAGAFVYLLVILKPAGETGPVKVYFFKGEALSPVQRRVSAGMAREKAAIDALLGGPTKSELAAGYYSEIPKGTKLNRISILGKTAVVDLEKRVGEYGGGTSSIRGILAQIVYTLTEIKGVTEVSLLIEGETRVVLGEEGYMLERPLTRSEVRF